MVAQDNREPYQGPERRKGERRQIPDRRELLRWEPDKKDRRSHIDRRDPGWDSNFDN